MIKRFFSKIYHGIVFLLYSLLYFVLFPFARLAYRRKHVWLINERGYDARDNGMHFFKYVSNNHPEIRAYYAITKDSPDRNNLDGYNNIIRFGSLKHIFLFAGAEAKISSQVFGYAPNRYFVKLLEKHHLPGKNIGLKHGIFKNIHPNYFKNNSHLDLVICGAKPEFDFVKANFGFEDSEVVYCGLARFDNLATTDVLNQILIMPTFRIPLSGLTTEEFMETDYYKNWDIFLKELDEKTSQLQGFRIVFYLHAVFQKFISAFEGKYNNITIANFADYDVQTLLNESKILVTDYSSVFFDFAYMRKPIVFYQFDQEFYETNHYQKGYFDYKLNGFGKVFASYNECFDELVHILNKQCKLDPLYVERVDSFFTLPKDHNNCSRIYEEIKRII